MKNNLVLTGLVSATVSAIVTLAIVLLFNENIRAIEGNAGYFSLSQPSATLTGYDWLQLNNKSDNKIHLLNGQVYVTSPSFLWNGDTVATQKWVEENCK